MADEEKVELKWFEVTWIKASGRTLVRAENDAEARTIASTHCEQGRGLAADGKRFIHQWIDPANEEPYVFDVEELAEDTAAELKKEMEGG